MNNDDKEIEELLKNIDNVPLLSDSDLEEMDFYELSYYMQALNQIDAIANSDESDGEE